MPEATVVHVITQLELGGAQEITLFTCRRLDRRRFRVHLVAGPGGLLDEEARAVPELTVHWIRPLVREIRPARDVRALAAIRRVIAEIRRRFPEPVIVHTHSSKAGILGRWAAWSAGADFRVHSIHGFSFHERQPRPLRHFYQTLEQWTAPITDAFCPVSAANLGAAASLGLLRGGKPAVLTPSGIAVADYDPAPGEAEAVRRELGLGATTPVVGMIACMKPQKAPLDFVRVAARVRAQRPDAHFFIAGDGVLRPAVEAAIAEAGLGASFHLVGWRRDVRRLLGAADVVVLTSLFEGLPRVVLQAMAARRPVVASRVDGVPEAVEDGRSGFLVAPGDVAGFADRIERLLADPGLACAMGQAGRARVAAFDERSMLRDLEALYETLLARVRPHRTAARLAGEVS